MVMKNNTNKFKKTHIPIMEYRVSKKDLENTLDLTLPKYFSSVSTS
jgi:hypothetical protein